MAAKKRRRYPKKHKQFLDTQRHKYDKILSSQKGVCFLCKRRPSVKRKLDMDHNHVTMELRGLLCWKCNRAVADWMTVDWAINLVQYLNQERINKLNA